LVEAVSKLGFSVEISRRRSAGQERGAEDQPAPLTGSSTRILKYVEDLRRGLNADIERKDFFEIASGSIGELICESKEVTKQEGAGIKF
jgi:hypothetical protein